MTRILTTGNPKIAKGLKQGYLTNILHLAPSRLSGYNVCPMATKGCALACLNTAGRGGIMKKGESTNKIQQARIRKTLDFFNDRETFMSNVANEIKNAIRLASKHGLTAVFRLNGTSDIRWETVPVTYKGRTYENIMDLFPTVQFYDYTKIPNRRNLPKNYHLTFSLAEDNQANAVIAGINGMNIATVFRKNLPKTFNVMPNNLMSSDKTVINGDDTDLRFLDPRGVIVGLKAKGKGKKDTSGFVKDI